MSMMKRRLVSLGVVFALGGAGIGIVFWQQQRGQRAKQREDVEKKVLRLDDPTQVTKISVRSSKGQTVVERQGDGWQVAAPLSTPADTTTVDGMLASLAGLQRLREVGEPGEEGDLLPPVDLALLGLDPARVTVELSLANGSSESLLLGKKNSFDGTLFAKRGDEVAVSQVPAAIEYQVDKSLFDVREKRLAVFEPDAVQKLTVRLQEDPEGGYALSRSGDGFRVFAPVDVLADRDQVGGILSALAELRAATFVSEAPTADDLKRFGLTPPSVRAVVDFGDAREPVILLFGSVTTDGDEPTHFLTREGSAPIVELSSDWAVRKLLTGVDDLRDKHVFNFDRDAVTELLIEHGDTALRFEKKQDEEKERGTWWMSAPAAKKAQDAILTGLLYKLWSLKAVDIVAESADEKTLAEHGLAPAALSATLYGEGGVELGTVKISGEQAGMRFANGTGSGRVDAVDAEKVAEIGTSAADYLADEADDG